MPKSKPRIPKSSPDALRINNHHSELDSESKLLKVDLNFTI